MLKPNDCLRDAIPLDRNAGVPNKSHRQKRVRGTQGTNAGNVTFRRPKQVGTQAGLNAYDDDHDESPYFRVNLGQLETMASGVVPANQWSTTSRGGPSGFLFFGFYNPTWDPATVRRSRRLPTYKAPAPTTIKNCGTAGRFWWTMVSPGRGIFSPAINTLGATFERG